MKIINSLVILHGIFAAIIFAQERKSSVCITPQYLYFGGIDSVQCSFKEGFYGVYWYNSTDSSNTFPLLAYEDSEKSGDGYFSGKFDIYPNGSLMIKNVSLRDDHIFRVIILHSPEEDAIIYDILVHVVVRSNQPYPFINICGKESFCFASLQEHSELSCVVNGTRPGSNLSLILQKDSDQLTIPSELSVLSSGNLFYSKIVTQLDFKVSNSIQVLKCEVSGNLEVTFVKSSKIFLVHTEKDYFPKDSEVRHVQRGARLTLDCLENNKTFIIWKRKLSSGKWDTIAQVYYLEKRYASIYDNDYGVDNNGSLILNYAGVEHEGSYLCLYSVWRDEKLQAFDVSVFVSPESPGIIVNGCVPDKLCILRVNSEGNLTCTVKGIRPKVKLKWFPFPEENSKYITFLHNDEVSTKTGDTYDVSLRSHYRLEEKSVTSATVECGIIGLENKNFHLEKTVELHFTIASTSADFERFPLYGLIPLAVIVTIAIIIVAVMTIRTKGCRKNYESSENPMSRNTFEMKPDAAKERLLMEQEKREFFKNHLKTKYGELYKVNPVPFVSGKRICVNDFFVPRCLKVSHTPPTKVPSTDYLESHHEILQAKYSTHSRFLLKGEHGSGKSTLTLQMAYEWCEERPYMKDYETFILLNMKKLYGMKSFNKAVQSIFFQNTHLEVSDIRKIVGSYSSGLIVLDDFDGFNEDDEENFSDFAKLVTSKLLPQFHVIIVTTPECIPSYIDHNAPQFDLMAFDQQHQNAYVDKNAKGFSPDFTKTISEAFQANPFLEKICELPLFFSLYIYFNTPNKNTVDSVTSLFRKMISAFSENNQAGITRHEKIKGDRKLSEIALDSLKDSCENKEQWEIDRLCRELGKDVVDYFKDIGLLVTGVHTFSQKTMKFRHKLLLEYYAAFHSDIMYTLENTKLHSISKYGICLACAVHQQSDNQVVKSIIDKQNLSEGSVSIYLELMKGLPQKEVRELCENFQAEFASTDTNKEQALLLLALKKNSREVDNLRLKNCLKLPKCSQHGLRLESGLEIPPSQALKKLELEMNSQLLEGPEAHPILEYVSSCKSMTTLRFSLCFLGGDFTEQMLRKFKGAEVSVEWVSCNENLWDLNFRKKRWELKSNKEKFLVPGQYTERHEYLNEKGTR